MISWILVIVDEYYDATTDKNKIAEQRTCGSSSSRRCDWIMQNNICVSTNLLDTDIVASLSVYKVSLTIYTTWESDKRTNYIFDVAFYNG